MRGRAWFVVSLTFSVSAIVEIASNKTLELFADFDTLVRAALLAFFLRAAIEYVIDYARRPQ
jgi:hypothetical protein